MIRVVILGAGNVAKHLYSAFFHQKHIEIIQCYNRKNLQLHPDQKKETIIKDIRLLKDADIYVLAVSDDAIEKVSSIFPFKNKLVVHTSGSSPMGIINNKNKKGVFYPLQTFSKDKIVNFTTIPICIEAENQIDLEILRKLASSLSNKVYTISSEQRSILHVSAVFVNNFTNYLFSIGSDICNEHRVPFEILHPLIQETAQKAIKMDPSNAQTGPAIRKDVNTIERHLEILTNTTQQNIYTTLTKAIQSKYGKEL
ncbi:Rossmann-like and DUF2520 domain-containing protein [Aquimarina muelleri]|uniref:DUF2520 domain-containing protein n=1 Tax=Aquimarina muelleri TaxID=279356 RepID=A0A918JU61_9FLAO|nr:DUF2520 domain-containing protein [Aquimarina muelleri]MCX2762997.1 DUF2520 domain-containing protein [Aquimarina muelleri]GGX15330.1 hypothetical protein GCM10007384_16260 [Aquimarina muelleri]